MNHQNRSEAVQGNRAARFPARILPWVLIVALFISNMATLAGSVRPDAHDFPVSVMKEVFGNLAGSVTVTTNRGQPHDAGRTADRMTGQNPVSTEREKKLESDVSRLQRENSDLEARRVTAENHLLKLQAEHGDLRTKHAALEKERNSLQAATVSRAKAVRNVADRISGKLAIHSGELIAELPMRAAPYVGVFALVTGTAFDIRSDCELVRTLNGLVLEHRQAPLDTHAVCRYVEKIPAASDVWSMVKDRSGAMAAPVYMAVERLYRN